MIPINRIQPKPEQDNSFMGGLTKALPLIGAGVGAAVGGPAGAGLGMGLGSATQGMLAKAPEMAQQQQQPGVGSDGSMSRRLESLKSNTSNHLQSLKQAAMALPGLPPEARAEAAQPIMTALIQDAYGRPMKG
jgi:hypothetical protein